MFSQFFRTQKRFYSHYELQILSVIMHQNRPFQDTENKKMGEGRDRGLSLLEILSPNLELKLSYAYDRRHVSSTEQQLSEQSQLTRACRSSVLPSPFTISNTISVCLASYRSKVNTWRKRRLQCNAGRRQTEPNVLVHGKSQLACHSGS